MHASTLVRRSLIHYWRTNLAVVAGVGVAVAVLAGALLVGASVRASLRDLALLRLGNVDLVVTSESFFREALADDLRAATGSSDARATVSLIALEGFVTHQTGGRRASSVQVFGVDERFWRFHQRTGSVEAQGPESAGAPAVNEVLLSEGLARELGAAEGDPLLVRVQKPSAIPVSSLHGRRDDLGRTIRLTVKRILAADALGEFSIRPQQGLARSVFLSLERLQRDLEQPGRVNAMLIGAGGRAPGIRVRTSVEWKTRSGGQHRSKISD